MTYLEVSVNNFGIPQKLAPGDFTRDDYDLPELEDILNNRDTNNLWNEYWGNIMKDNQSDCNPFALEKLELNKYYMPLFWDYFKHHMLPNISMWSSLCLGNLARFNKEYQKNLQTVSKKGRTYLLQNQTNAQIERFFGMKKEDKSCTPQVLDNFILQCWKMHQGARRQYVAALLKGLRDKTKPKTEKQDAKRMEPIFLGRSDDKKLNESLFSSKPDYLKKDGTRNLRRVQKSTPALVVIKSLRKNIYILTLSVKDRNSLPSKRIVLESQQSHLICQKNIAFANKLMMNMVP